MLVWEKDLQICETGQELAKLLKGSALVVSQKTNGKS